jgi:hypothetical protein
MRCDDVRDRLDVDWDTGRPQEVQQHLAECSACSGYFRDLRTIRAGFRLWQLDAVPDGSPGFAERLVRQLGGITRAQSVADFIERVGRRFVSATFALTLLTLLALALPSTGPIRSLGATDIQVPTQEASLTYFDPMGETGVLEFPEQQPASLPIPDSSQEAQ